MRSRLLALALLVSGSAAGGTPSVTLTAPDTIEPGRRLAAKLTIRSDAPAPTTWRVEYTLQADSAMYALPPPDPLYGSDHARGARSRTVVEGKTLEEGSLTDGKDYTDAGTAWKNEGYSEAFQYVDLGRARRVTRLTYLAGDANHSWKLDVAASGDGRRYAPVPGLQGFDTYQRWGEVVLPLPRPITARFLRLRYHKDGQKSPVFRMPCRLSVYDGAADEAWDLPRVGEGVGGGRTALTVPGGAEKAVLLSPPGPLGPGLYLLAARVSGGEQRHILYRRILALPSPMAQRSPESRFGINGASPGYTPLLRRLGIGWVRFENLKWPFVSPQPGVYRFDGSVKPWQVNADAIFQGYRGAGLRILPFLFMTADYASSAPPGVAEGRRYFYPPRTPDDFAAFAFQVAARYGAKAHPASVLKTSDGRTGLGYLHTYEVWNEPNLTDPGWGPWVGTQAQYLEMLRAASEAIKRADPAARVTNAGYAGIQVKTVDTLRTHTYADGKRPLDFVDILNVHFYSGRIPPETATDDFNAGLSGDTTAEQDFRRLTAWRDRSKPGMPIWLSETGYDSAGPYGTDERTQAARLPRMVMLALANGMEKVFVYRESGSAASMHAASGLLREDGSVKPSYLTYATLIRELDGIQGGAVQLPLSDRNARLYLWRRGGKLVLAAWAIEGTARLPLDLGRVTLTDAFGRHGRADLRRGLTLTEFPVYIRDLSSVRALNGLIARQRRDEARAAQRNRARAQAAAYLFKFGGPVPGVTLDWGRERPYTPVLPGDVYTDATGYGFWPGPAGETQDRSWVRADLDRVVLKIAPGTAFRVRAAPGRYILRLGVGPYDNAHLTLKGAAGGDRTLPVAKGDGVVETTLNLPGGMLSLSLDNYATLRWLTLVERGGEE